MELRKLSFLNEKLNDSWQHSYCYIQEQLSSGPMEDFNQVSNTLLPDVESMLTSRTCHYVFTITRETTFLPRCPASKEKRNHRRLQC